MDSPTLNEVIGSLIGAICAMSVFGLFIIGGIVAVAASFFSWVIEGLNSPQEKVKRTRQQTRQAIDRRSNQFLEDVYQEFEKTRR
jgi:hypothetical protein